MNYKAILISEADWDNSDVVSLCLSSSIEALSIVWARSSLRAESTKKGICVLIGKVRGHRHLVGMLGLGLFLEFLLPLPTGLRRDIKHA